MVFQLFSILILFSILFKVSLWLRSFKIHYKVNIICCHSIKHTLSISHSLTQSSHSHKNVSSQLELHFLEKWKCLRMKFQTKTASVSHICERTKTLTVHWPRNSKKHIFSLSFQSQKCATWYTYYKQKDR